MTYATATFEDYAPRGRIRVRSKGPGAAILALTALAAGAAAAAWMLSVRPAPAPTTAAPAAARIVVVTPSPYRPFLDPSYSLGVAPVRLGEAAPLGAAFASLRPIPQVLAAAPTAAPPPTPADPLPRLRIAAIPPSVPLPPPAPARTTPAANPPVAAAAELAQLVPPRRPASIDPPAPSSSATFHLAGRRLALQQRTTVAMTPPPDNRSFFEKIFGAAPKPAGSALAYAAPDDGLFGRGRSLPATAALPSDRQTAVYDIAAHTVYMPDGTQLEAHSGLGSRLDDPRSVHERNLGATPPQVYELTPREQLFHGVQALRLNPVGGGGTFGRVGLLAHTYMLGPNGDSNGCVSFKNYQAFLQAYMQGTVKRLVVVARPTSGFDLFRRHEG